MPVEAFADEKGEAMLITMFVLGTVAVSGILLWGGNDLDFSARTRP